MNKERLKDLMEDTGLTRKEIARILNISSDTVNAWLKSGKSARQLPDNILELLELKANFRIVPKADVSKLGVMSKDAKLTMSLFRNIIRVRLYKNSNEYDAVKAGRMLKLNDCYVAKNLFVIPIRSRAGQLRGYVQCNVKITRDAAGVVQIEDVAKDASLNIDRVFARVLKKEKLLQLRYDDLVKTGAPKNEINKIEHQLNTLEFTTEREVDYMSTKYTPE